MENRREHDSAFADYSNAIRCDPNLASAFYQRGLIFMLRKDFASAISDFSEAIRSSPAYAAAYLERGNAFMQMGRQDEALASFDSAIAEAPAFGRAYAARARFHRQNHELEKALRDFNEAVRLDPKPVAVSRERDGVMREAIPETWSIAVINEAIDRNARDDKALEMRGSIYLAQHEYECAISDFTECIKLTQSQNAYCHRAETYFKAGDYPSAIVDYEEGAHHGGAIAVGTKRLAWLLATCPNAVFRNGARAVEEAKHDCDRTAWKNWNSIDTLAAALAEAGNFDDAVTYENQALAMKEVPANSRTELQQRLSLYKSRKPYRDNSK
jgi:tetratricopeptide (TPR) repeat protein